MQLKCQQIAPIGEAAAIEDSSPSRREAKKSRNSALYMLRTLRILRGNLVSLVLDMLSIAREGLLFLMDIVEVVFMP